MTCTRQKRKRTKEQNDDDDGGAQYNKLSLSLSLVLCCRWLFGSQTKAPKRTPSHAAAAAVKRKKERKRKWPYETYVNDDHLYVADDENAVFVGLRDVDVAIRHGDGTSPAAVDALGAANVVL